MPQVRKNGHVCLSTPQPIHGGEGLDPVRQVEEDPDKESD